MLSIIVARKSLDLDAATSITLKFLSPVFNEIGDHSFPFKLPSTAKNKVILHWKNRVENSCDKYEFFPAVIRWNNIDIFSGSLRIQSAGLDYEGVLYVDKGNFNYEIKNRNLHELDMGRLRFTSQSAAMAYFNSTLDKTFPQVSIAFPEVKNEHYFDPPDPDPSRWYYNLKRDGLLYPTTPLGNESLLIPNIYLRWVLEKIASLFGYTLDDQFFSSREELNNLVIYNSRTVLISAYYNPGTIHYHNHVPRLKVNKFLAGLETMFNCHFFVDQIRKKITIRGGGDILRSPKSIQFSNLVSGMTVVIPEKITGFRFSSKPDEGDCEFSLLTSIEQALLDRIKGSVDTAVELYTAPYNTGVAIGDLWYVISEDKWYEAKFTSALELTWEISTDLSKLYSFFPLSIQDDLTKKVETDFSTLVGSSYVLCGNLASDYKSITPRLFYVRVVDNVVKAYSAAVPPDLNLYYSGINGLFNEFWSEWAHWMMFDRVMVEFKKQLTMMEIKNLDFSAKHEIGGNHYLLSEVQVTLTNTQIKPATIKAYSCY